MSERPIRIGNFSGYLGDRFTALDEALAGDPVDVLIGDYLAEITLAALSAGYRRDGSGGYVGYFVDQLRPHLATIAERGIKVVANAGGFNPAGLAIALRDAAAADGVTVNIAHIEGDNLLAELPDLQSSGETLSNMDTGAALSDWGCTPIAANAYLGGWGVAAALAEGADIVVCGRVTDASLTVGPAAWWHGWRRDQWDELAGAVLAGHIIECGPHATGGNFSGFTTIPNMLVPGFPIGEIDADGTAVITKHGRDGGAVTTDTVTAQLLYEIQGPRYLNPDVTVHLDDVAVTELEPDRVLVSGAKGTPAPPTTKVAVFGQVGHQIMNMVYVTAPELDAKVELLTAQFHRDLPEGVTLDITRIGTAAVDPESQWDATVGLRIMATSREREPLDRYNLAGRVGSLYLQSIPGYFHDGASTLRATPRPVIDYWPAVLTQDKVGHRAVFAGGHVVDVPAPSATAAVTAQPVHPEPTPVPLSAQVSRVPLGTVAYARSGDKGGNSNVGIWAISQEAWPWLRAELSTEGLRALLPELKELDVVRHEFPNLRAVHFVLRGLLGTGGSANQRIDQVGKAVGEYIRAKHVLVPSALVKES
ncbi:acyclic terpene utilization AtuA family protein [Pseudonocardia spinosispora]|uniref:acyclic terpene utilization AtuA family protein n=1 Tax=Pseudonocardia spinosispora TaxID=103441 RepID=UPI00048F2AED|nr:acyclic terpene utilization AtuA family protein [Pseudonocardia spinosispora]